MLAPPPSHGTLELDTAKPQLWPRTLLILTVALVLIVTVFWSTVTAMVATWYQSSTFSHQFLIVPISLYLIWSQRNAIALLTPVPNLWGLVCLGGATVVWLVGNIADVLVVQQFAWLSSVQLLVWTLLGSAVTRVLVFPLLFLWFALPAGEGLVPLLQDFTAAFAVAGLQFSGVPVFVEGRFIAVPSGGWRVAEACAGVRYVIAALPLGCLFAWTTYRSWTRRVVFVALSVVVTILANGVRAYGIIMLGYLSNNRIAVGVDHLIYGGVFFVLVMLVLFAIGSRWQEPVKENLSSTTSLPDGSQTQGLDSRRVSGRAMVTAAVYSIAVVSLGPLWASAMSSSLAHPVEVQASIPQVTSPWQVEKEYVGIWAPHCIGPDAEVKQSYRLDTRHVHLYIAYYAQQRQGAEVINTENAIADEREWVHLTDGQTTVEIDSERLVVRTATFGSPGRDHLVWTWYWVDGQFTANPYYAKWLQVKTQLLGGPSAAAVVAVSTDSIGDPAEAALRLQEFLSHLTSLQATLRGFSLQPPSA
ncbi:MAG: exosortase A [Candidatus Binatia bacterium]